MPAPRTPRPRRVNEHTTMLKRPLDRDPGADFLLVLHNPTGSITGAVHQGRVLDATEAEALRQAHPRERSGGG